MSEKTFLNRQSARDLGWDPTWWSMPPGEWGRSLEDQIRAFQESYGMVPTGVVDVNTWLRLLNERMAEEAVEAAVEVPMGDFIVHDGKRLPIPWDRVVSFDEDGGYAIERYYTSKEGKKRSRFCERGEKYGGIHRVGFHWTATTSARKSFKYCWSARRSVSTHFEIDYDGTIYQLVDTRYASYNYGARWMNHSSVGVDITLHPGKVGKAKETNEKLVKAGQPERPIMTGWSLNGWKPKNFVGPHEVQIEALRALMWALNEHLGIPLEAPADDPDKPKHIERFGDARKGKFKLSQCPPGWWHHCVGVKNRWDTLGVALTEELGKAAELGGSKKKATKKKATKKKATKKKSSKKEA